MSKPTNANNQAIIPYAGRQTLDVQVIMNLFVARTSVENYMRNNVNLMLHLFDVNAETHLHDSIIDEAKDADELDFTLDQKENGKRSHLRALCKDRLSKVNKHNNNCPIILETITFNVFSNYLANKKTRRATCCARAPTVGCEVP